MQSETPPAVLAEFRAEMARRSITAERLALDTGKHPQTVGRYLSGQTDMPFGYAIKVAAHLGVPLSRILDRAEEAVA